MSARNDDPWTVQKRFGFGDEDLKTSEHDKIMMWLDEKMPAILNWFFKPNEWPDRTLRVIQDEIKGTKERIISDCEASINKYKNELHWATNNPIHDNIKIAMEKLAEAEKKAQEVHMINTENIDIPPVPNIECYSKTWEYVITSGHRNQYTVGFIDLVAEFSIPTLDKTGPPFDIVAGHERYTTKAFFEVKAKMDSLGQLIRQIRLYQQYVGSNNWFVVSPDDSFEKQLKGQGIGFIKYKG